MKKNQIILLAFILTILSCKKKVESKVVSKSKKTTTKITYKIPEDVGKSIFVLINKFNKITQEEYKNNIISYSDLKELADDKKTPIGEYIRNDFKSITAESYERAISQDFEGIKSAGKKFNIDWQNIKFINFINDIQQIDEGKMLLGETYFKNVDNKIYFVKCAAIFNGKDYQIIKIAEVELKSNKRF